jgi:hypothetical protein
VNLPLIPRNKKDHELQRLTGCSAGLSLPYKFTAPHLYKRIIFQIVRLSQEHLQHIFLTAGKQIAFFRVVIADQACLRAGKVMVACRIPPSRFSFPVNTAFVPE